MSLIKIDMFRLPDECVVGPLSLRGTLSDSLLLRPDASARIGFILGKVLADPALSFSSSSVPLNILEIPSQSLLQLRPLRVLEAVFPSFSVPLSREALKQSSEFTLAVFIDSDTPTWTSQTFRLSDQSLRVYRTITMRSNQLPSNGPPCLMELEFKVELFPSGSIVPLSNTAECQAAPFGSLHTARSGRRVCPKCEGHGGSFCSQCGGAASLDCADCGGVGFVVQTVAAVTATTAAVPVISRSRCNGCNGGKVDCWGCAGVGRKRCDVCGGLGDVRCRGEEEWA